MVLAAADHPDESRRSRGYVKRDRGGLALGEKSRPAEDPSRVRVRKESLTSHVLAVGELVLEGDGQRGRASLPKTCL
jgi:hypothetical protein